MRATSLRVLLTGVAVLGSPLRGQDAVWDRFSVTARTTPDSLVGFDGRRADAERTTLTIRQRAPGRADTMSLDVVFLRLAARRPSGRAPIIFLMGGPGVPASIIGRVPPYWTLFQQLRDSADVILLDQRGTGRSTHRQHRCDGPRTGACITLTRPGRRRARRPLQVSQNRPAASSATCCVRAPHVRGRIEAPVSLRIGGTLRR